MLRSAICGAVVALGLATGAASATQLECKVDAGLAQGNWIGTEYYFEYDAKAKAGTVLDGIIYHYFKAPIAAKVTVKDGVKVAFSWSVKSKSTTGNQVNMQYRAAYFFADKTLSVTAVPPGYSGNFTARGTCKQK